MFPDAIEEGEEMKEDEMYFDGITVGTKVYDRDGKEWKVEQIDYCWSFPVRIHLGEIWWDSDLEGYARGYEIFGQQFFWSPPPKIVPPPRPKRMVKHKEIFLDVEWNDRGYDPLYPSGTNLFGKLRKVTGKKTTMTLEWEEEE